MNQVLISEFAQRIGVTPDTVRFYEKIGFFSRYRRKNGYRDYTEADIETAELISSGKSMGFSLREIHVFLDEMNRGTLDHPAVQASLQEKIRLINDRISALKKAKAIILEHISYCREVELNEKIRSTPDPEPDQRS